MASESAFGFANSTALLSGGAAFSLACGIHSIVAEGRAARARAQNARDWRRLFDENQALIERLARMAERLIEERDAWKAEAQKEARANQVTRANLSKAVDRLRTLGQG